MNKTLSRLFRVQLLLLLFFFCGCTEERQTHKLQVVASIAPLSYFAERIGGRKVALSVMVPPGGNPQSYEPRPRQMARLADAALFIKAGSGVEFELNWMQRFLSLNPALKVCNGVEHITLLPMKDEEDALHHGRYDPHYWLSPLNGIIIARNVEAALVAVDPQHQEEYRANAGALVAELQALDREIRSKLAPLKNRRFLVFHPAWGYYAHAYALEQIAAEEEGKTLTPKQMQRVIEKAQTNHIRVVLLSPQFNASQAEAIAREIGGITRSVDPLASDYQHNLRRATSTFLESMQ